jgi:hypothetical protein
MKTQRGCDGSEQKRRDSVTLQVTDHYPNASDTIELGDEDACLLIAKVVQHLGANRHVHAAIADGERKRVARNDIVGFRSCDSAEDKRLLDSYSSRGQPAMAQRTDHRARHIAGA